MGRLVLAYTLVKKDLNSASMLTIRSNSVFSSMSNAPPKGETYSASIYGVNRVTETTCKVDSKSRPL